MREPSITTTAAAIAAACVIALVISAARRPQPEPETAGDYQANTAWLNRQIDRFERCLATEDVNTCDPPRLPMGGVDMCYGEGVINGRPPAWEVCRDYD